MAYGSGHERTVVLFTETTFGQPPADWSASGTAFLCIEPNFEGVQQGSIENENYRLRALATREKVPALRNGQVSFGVYATGRGGNSVAEGSQATTDYLAALMQSAWGGVTLGYRANIAAGSTATSVNVAAGTGGNFPDGSALFLCDASDSNRGRFVVVLDRSTDALALKVACPFGSPDAADTGGAVITSYFNTDALVAQSDADYTTLSLIAFGELSDDVVQVSGCKPNLTAIEGIAPGEAPVLRFEVLCATHDNEGVTAPTGFTDPAGLAPVVTATGSDTYVSIAAYGTEELVDVEAQAVTITPGVVSQPVPCVGGVEGRSGYTLTGFDDTMLEIVVDYDDSWMTAWESRTQYHVMVQIGATAGTAVGWYAPRVELAEDPQRTVSTDMATTTLKFRCLEDTATTADSGNQLEMFRSKLLFLRSVPL